MLPENPESHSRQGYSLPPHLFSSVVRCSGDESEMKELGDLQKMFLMSGRWVTDEAVSGTVEAGWEEGSVNGR